MVGAVAEEKGEKQKRGGSESFPEEQRDQFVSEQQQSEKARRAVKGPAVVEGNTAGYSPVVGETSVRKAKWVFRVEGHADVALGVVRAQGNHGLQIHASPDAWAFWLGSRLQSAGGVGSAGRKQGPDSLSLPASVELELDALHGTLTLRAHGAIFGFMETLPAHGARMRLAVGTGHSACKVTLLRFVDLEIEGDPLPTPRIHGDNMQGYGATTEELRRQVDELRAELWIERRARQRAEEELRRGREEDEHVAPLQLGGLFNPLLAVRASRVLSAEDISPGARSNRRGSTGTLPRSTTTSY